MTANIDKGAAGPENGLNTRYTLCVTDGYTGRTCARIGSIRRNRPMSCNELIDIFRDRIPADWLTRCDNYLFYMEASE